MMPCILMVSDCFLPDLGGVESHIYNLSQRLIDIGYKVVVLTRFRGNRHGIRWMANGLKVYHLPTIDVYLGASFPTLIYLFPLLRTILIREEVDLIHSHAACS